MSAIDPRSCFYIGYNPDHMYYTDWAATDESGVRLWPKEDDDRRELQDALILIGAFVLFLLIGIVVGP